MFFRPGHYEIAYTRDTPFLCGGELDAPLAAVMDIEDEQISDFLLDVSLAMNVACSLIPEETKLQRRDRSPLPQDLTELELDEKCTHKLKDIARKVAKKNDIKAPFKECKNKCGLKDGRSHV